jgi:cytoskeletal protein RodZ
MTSLGTALREARESKGLSLEEISTRTKIRQSYLEAIESDRLETIPGGFFSRSFAKQYAEALGVGSDIAALLEATTPTLGEDVKLQKLTDYRSPNKSLILPSGKEEEGTEFYHEAAFLKDRRSNTGWMIAAALLVCLSMGYLAWTKRPELFASFTRTGNVGKTETPPPPQPAPESKAAVPESGASTQLAESKAPAAIAPVVVEVKAVEPTWLRLSADGRQTFDGTLAVGETKTLTGGARAEVFTGNAGGLDLTYNGKPVGPVGPSGRVRTVVFTPETFEIRASSQFPQRLGRPSSEGVAREP